MKSNPYNPEFYLRTASALAAAPRNAPVVALVRHAEKEARADAVYFDEESHDIRRMLTKRGKTDAKRTGRLLQGRVVRIEHSHIPRCLQTAQNAADGAAFGGKIIENKNLAGWHMFPSHKALKQAKDAAGGFSELMDRIAAGYTYPEITPLLPAMGKMAGGLFSTAKPGINLAVSHDWILYLMLAAIGAEIQIFDKERVCYLEPLFLWKKDGRMVFYYRNREGECNSSFSDIAKSANR